MTSAGLLGCLFLLAIDGFERVGLPWEPTGQPIWIVFFGLLAATQFTYREVRRQYGKRALHEDQAPE
ncbi:MAG: hypothetical protein EON87_17980 [Brevundimonas sp.]|nr:MAG: hypothetical protein EON87_17980 [Brevundimonas sp.]